MTCDEWLARVHAANPALFAAARITLTPAALDQLLRQTYAAALAEAAARALPSDRPDRPPGFEALFGRLGF